MKRIRVGGSRMGQLFYTGWKPKLKCCLMESFRTHKEQPGSTAVLDDLINPKVGNFYINAPAIDKKAP